MIQRTNAEKYCSEDIAKIENYEQAVNDDTQTWHCHHRLEIQGQFRNSPSLLKKCGLYYNVPAWQLIFLTPKDHYFMHNSEQDINYIEKTNEQEDIDALFEDIVALVDGLEI